MLERVARLQLVQVFHEVESITWLGHFKELVYVIPMGLGRARFRSGHSSMLESRLSRKALSHTSVI